MKENFSKSVPGFLGAIMLATAPFLTLTAGPPSKPVSGVQRWVVYTYFGSDWAPTRSNPLPGGGVSFDFFETPDRAQIGTAHPSYQRTLLGNQFGRTLSAVVSITAAPGTKFTYYRPTTIPCSSDRPANVRLYFETKNRQLGESQFWWSNPVSLDLETLNAGGLMKIAAQLDPEKWSDRAGSFGNADLAHQVAFQWAASKITFIGLSFGGGCFFAFGAGSEPAGAAFNLHDFASTP